MIAENRRLGFWLLVSGRESQAECWRWEGRLNFKGYGYFGLLRAHRISWSMANGPIPQGLMVLHRCDNPACVNPAHLFLGTAKDNAQDALNKGRHVSQSRPDVQVRGDAHGQAKLTSMQVRAIREAHKTGQSIHCLAALHGVSRVAIRKILRRITWTHLE